MIQMERQVLALACLSPLLLVPMALVAYAIWLVWDMQQH